MAEKVKAWVLHGGFDRSGWCELHALPHLYTYSLYRLTPEGVTFLKTVKQCDLR